MGELFYAKDAYYFPHDSNANSDPKCILLIEQLGLEGYGIFWVLIETLREQPGYMYPLNLLPALARRFNTTHEKMNVVVRNYGLFQIIDGSFYSESLARRMEVFDYKRELARNAGRISAQKRLGLSDNSTDVEQPSNDGSTSKVKYSKVNQTKVNKNNKFIPPTLEQVQNYCIERQNGVDPVRWINYYLANGWMVGRNKMKDWQAAVRTWERNNYGGQNAKSNQLTSAQSGGQNQSTSNANSVYDDVCNSKIIPE